VKCSNVTVRWLLSAIAVLSVFFVQPGRAESHTEFLLFPYVQGSYLSGLKEDSSLDNDENDFGLDVFAALERGRFQFLGEALLSKDEQEIERFQLGWRTGDSKIWLGRFHNPIGYWNTRYHHGAFLQTSITRPSIVEFEDDGGVLPTHLTGLLIEGVKEQDTSALGYEVAIAMGPELTDQLEAFDLLSPGSGSQGLALTFNIYRQPTAYAPTQYGLFANYSEIPATERGIDEIRQTSAGGYWNWESDPWRLIGSAYYVRNQLEQPSENQTDDFAAAYFQIDRHIDDKWLVFGRAEKTFASRNDAYLELFPDQIREKILAGLRFNIGSQHALTLEVSGNRSQEDHYRMVMLQWAAMF
jgi:hypothetical protein